MFYVCFLLLILKGIGIIIPIVDIIFFYSPVCADSGVDFAMDEDEEYN